MYWVFLFNTKKERVNRVKYYDYKSAKLDLFIFIESWYNRKRIHGSIGYITPQMKEDLFRITIWELKCVQNIDLGPISNKPI